MSELANVTPIRQNPAQKFLYAAGEVVVGEDKAREMAPYRVRRRGAGLVIGSVLFLGSGLAAICAYDAAYAPDSGSPQSEQSPIDENGMVTVQSGQGAAEIYEVFADPDDSPAAIDEIQQQGQGENNMLMRGQKIVLPPELRD